MIQLPKIYYRVAVSATEDAKLWVYQRGSKTYASRDHAFRAAREFGDQGFDVKVFETINNWSEISEREWDGSGD